MKVSRFYILWFILMLLMTLSLIGCSECNPCKKANFIQTDFNPADYVLNPVNVYKEIMRNDIKFSEIVLKQSILESGWYKSYNCTERKNLFGMTGGTKTKDNIHGYAIYSNWMQSVKAYKDWQAERLTPDVSNYYQFLRDWSYAESEDYERKLKGINVIIVKK